MCGIVGFYAKEVVASEVLEAMASSIQHRGPNDAGYVGLSAEGKWLRWNHPGEVSVPLRFAMAFRRLAILDLTAEGAQPMVSRSGRHWLCFNGEIYNYLELRESLAGVTFSSSGDTQVLLHLLEARGTEALPLLNGMFAFSFFDVEKKRLSLVRDPLGIKPLYYENRKEGFFFGSEIRALLAAHNEAPRLQASLLSRHLLCQWLTEPDTLFQGISRLEPGTVLEVGENLTVMKSRYWDFSFARQESLPRSKKQFWSFSKPHVSVQGHGESKTWESRIEEGLKQAVSRQLRSDVPVAFFLSGGLDSSLLAALAAKARPESITAYTIGFSWSGRSEDSLDERAARHVAKTLGLNHKEMILSPQVVHTLPKVIRAMEEPVSDPAAICSYLICEAASDQYRVLISGQGADELFGGYGFYQNAKRMHWAQGLYRYLPVGTTKAAKWLSQEIADRPHEKWHRLQKLLSTIQHPWPQSLFLLRSGFLWEEWSGVLTKPFQEIQEDPFLRHLEIWKSINHRDVVEQAMFWDLNAYLPGVNLFYSDKTSMAHSVELRVPYLDQNLVELVRQLPLSEKWDGHRHKIILKKIAKAYLPREVIERKKTGFGLPVRDWLRHELQPLLKDWLNPTLLKAQGIFEPNLVANWIKEHEEGKRDHSAKLFALLSFQFWKDSFHVR